MSENKDSTIFEEITKKYFNEVEHSVPHLHERGTSNLEGEENESRDECTS